MFDMSSIIDLLGSQALVMKRRAAGSFTAGRYAQGAESNVNITGSMQPLSARDIERLPDGIRERAEFKLFTISTLQTGEMADRTTYNTIVYEIQSVKDWKAQGNYNVYVMVKVEV